MEHPEANLITTKKCLNVKISHREILELVEFHGSLNSFLPRLLHKERQGVNLVMIAAFTLAADCE